MTFLIFSIFSKIPRYFPTLIKSLAYYFSWIHYWGRAMDYSQTTNQSTSQPCDCESLWLSYPTQFGQKNCRLRLTIGAWGPTGIFGDHFIVNLLLSLPTKESMLGDVMAKNTVFPLSDLRCVLHKQQLQHPLYYTLQ